MADIEYSPIFKHEDWIDNEDVVQADGDKGFNKKFRAIEVEFDKVSKVVSDINVEIKNIQRLKFIQAKPPLTLAGRSASEEFLIEEYGRDEVPANVEKAYFVVIFPSSGYSYIQHTILYREIPGNRVRASVQFYNPAPDNAKFAFRVLTLAVQL